MKTAIEILLHSNFAIFRSISDIHINEMIVGVVSVQQTEFLVFVYFPLLGRFEEIRHIYLSDCLSIKTIISSDLDIPYQ